jgi:iron complex transport system ATP-binding protein
MDILVMEKIYFSYNEKPFLKGLDFAVSESEIVALLGPNGSGKSTILKLASGILRPKKGSIRLWNKDIFSYAGKDRAKLISYLPQVLDFSLPFTVEELVSMGLYPYDIEPQLTLEDAMAMVGLLESKDTLITELSGGERRRAFLAMTLLQGAGLLLLDEPMANLDIKYQIELIKLLKELRDTKGISMVMALHDINMVHHFDRVYVLKHGTVVASGRPVDVVTERLLREVYEVEIKIYPQENGSFLFGV